MPGGWSRVALDADVRVRTEGGPPALPPVVAAGVAACWEAALRERPELFNGRVFSADRIGRSEIVGHWTEYRRVLAGMRVPALRERLAIRALAVNGLLQCPEGLVLGRRRAGAVYLPGCWQAAPAGNVEARGNDAIDLRAQLEAELLEELGLGAGDVAEAAPVVAIGHAEAPIVDVGFLMRTAMPFGGIEARWRALGNGEYDRLRVVAAEAVDEVLERSGPTVLPSALILLRCWREAARGAF